MSRRAFGADFAGAEGYLNTASYGLPPTFVMDGLSEYLMYWESGTLELAALDGPIQTTREAFAALVGVESEAVALAASVSGAVGLVAAAVRDGSRVATLAGEFTSVTFPFAAQAGRGVTVTELTVEELLSTAADYDVVAVSLVQSADGAVLDTAALRAAVAGTDTWIVIDATQALGWTTADVSWADVVAAPGYKWLLAPRGCAWMAVSDRVADAMTPHAANWYGAQDPWSSIYGLPLRLSADVRRFDASPVWFSFVGASLSLPWVASLDRAAVQAHNVGLAARVRAELELPPSPSAIVSIPGVDDAVDRLRESGIRAARRAGAVRVSFHLYNTDDDVDKLLSALRG